MVRHRMPSQHFHSFLLARIPKDPPNLPTESTYIMAGVHDANGKRTTVGFDTLFGEGEVFTAVELGWFPNEFEANERMYHITL